MENSGEINNFSGTENGGENASSIYLVNLATTFGALIATVFGFLVLMFVLRIATVTEDTFDSIINLKSLPLQKIAIF